METGNWKNKLYFGDNLDILREYVASETVDLIYLDPPFNSNATYNVLFQEKSGEKSAAQITAFEDTWHWGMESEYTYQEVVKEGSRKLADLLQAMRTFLGQNDMMAYLVMMAQRMVELHRVLKPTGSIYLHCDPTASHYLKLLMDAVFGHSNFRNEIIWKRSDAKGDTGQGAKHFGRVNDTILFYTKAENNVFNSIYGALNPDYVEKFYRYKDPDGRRYKLDNMLGPGGAAKGNPYYEVMGVSRYWRYSKERMKALIDAGRVIQTKPGTVPMYKRYLDESKGTPITTNWSDISLIRGWSNEKLGYPTQKPEALLERIILASSIEGDFVLDPFCGCGTAIAVAERLHRRWIGIDITHLAISLMRHRLHDTFGSDLTPYVVIGDPKDLSSARALAEENRFQFEWWSLGLVDARPAQDKRKGADRGVDGYINFFDDNSGKAKTIVVQVKSGHINAAYIRDLKGVLEREKAPIGVLITLEKPTKPMLQEAAAGGFYEPEHWPGHYYPKIQILTIQELLDSRQVEYPRHAPIATFKKAKRLRKIGNDEQGRML